MTATTLRALERADLEQLRRWRNSDELRARTRHVGWLSEAHQERWWSRITGPDSRDFMFAVLNGVTKQLIGCVGLCDWLPRDATAEISFYIGSEEHQRHGHGTRAVRLLHEIGFRELGLTRIWAEVYAFNRPGVAVLERTGYALEGRLRGHVYRLGQRHDALRYGLLREEWRP